MCKCCETIEFLKEEEKNKNSKIYARIAVFSWREGKRRIGSEYYKCLSRPFNMDYCPMCGRRLGE